MLGTRRWMDVVQVVRTLRNQKTREPYYHLPDVPDSGGEVEGILRVTRQGGSAYIKIADGCRRPCAFCAIPLIKGKAVSRPLESIVHEAGYLQSVGVKELVLIAQDPTDYGSDLGISDGLSRLLEMMTDQGSRYPLDQGHVFLSRLCYRPVDRYDGMPSPDPALSGYPAAAWAP